MIFYKEPRFREPEDGFFPIDWDAVPVARLFRVETGATPSTSNPAFWKDGTVNWLTPVDLSGLDSDIHVGRSERRVSERALKETNLTLVPKRSIILSTRAPVGYAAVLEEPSAFNQGCKALVPMEGDQLVPEFYCHYLVANQKSLQALSGGSTFIELSKENLEKFLVPKPPLDEQLAISEVLSTMDEAILMSKRIIAESRRLKKGIIRNLFEEGIDHTRFKAFRSGTIPENWEVAPFGEHCTSHAYGPRFPSELYFKDGNISVIRTTDFDEVGIDYNTVPKATLTLDFAEPHLLRKGDLLITRSGTLGLCAVFSESHGLYIPGAYLIRFRMDSSIHPEWLRYYLMSPVGSKSLTTMAEGGVQKNLKGSAILSVQIPVPPLPEQLRITDMVDAATAQIKVEVARNESLQRLKKGLVQTLLTGKVRVKVN